MHHRLQREGGHAGVMHRRHGQGEQGAAQFRGEAEALGRHPQGQGAAANGDTQRHARQQRLIGYVDAWLIGDHGDEVRAPDGRAGGHRPHEDPRRPRALLCVAQSLEQSHGDQGTQQTQGGRDADEPQIMVVGQTRKNTHYDPWDMLGSIP